MTVTGTREEFGALGQYLAEDFERARLHNVLGGVGHADKAGS
jgi:hypothetical protein